LEGIRKGSFADRWVSSIDYGNVKAWDGPFPGQPAIVRTGPDGRFSLAGLSTNEIVRLRLEGPAIQHVGDIQVTSRPGPGAVWPRPDRQDHVWGADFDYVAALARPIHGMVRDKITGRPIAGASIRSYATAHSTQTDREGRYE